MSNNSGKLALGIKLPTRTNASPQNGEIWYDGTVLQSRQNGVTVPLDNSGGGGGGSGTGRINYITNWDAETDASGYSAYADAAGATPVDGTGGSPNVTIARNTTTPLRGTGDFLLTKDAANRQGQGVSYDFTIDLADRSQNLEISFDYSTGGTFVAGTSSDLRVFVYDVTNTTVINLKNRYLLSSSGKFRSQFLATTSTSYRLIIHVATTSANAYTLNFDNVLVGPKLPGMIAVTNTLDFSANITPSAGFGTVTGKDIVAYRKGDRLFARGSFFLGTSAASQAELALGGSFVIDTAKMVDSSRAHAGYIRRIASGVNFENGGQRSTDALLFVDSATSNTILYLAVDGSATPDYATTNVNTTGGFGTGDKCAFEFEIPIVGWAADDIIDPGFLIP